MYDKRTGTRKPPKSQPSTDDEKSNRTGLKRGRPAKPRSEQRKARGRPLDTDQHTITREVLRKVEVAKEIASIDSGFAEALVRGGQGPAEKTQTAPASKAQQEEPERLQHKAAHVLTARLRDQRLANEYPATEQGRESGLFTMRQRTKREREAKSNEPPRDYTTHDWLTDRMLDAPSVQGILPCADPVCPYNSLLGLNGVYFGSHGHVDGEPVLIWYIVGKDPRRSQPLRYWCIDPECADRASKRAGPRHFHCRHCGAVQFKTDLNALFNSNLDRCYIDDSKGLCDLCYSKVEEAWRSKLDENLRSLEEPEH